MQFTALLHHVTPEQLTQSYKALKPKAAPGVDGVTQASYGENLEYNIKQLHAKVHNGKYRAKPSRRCCIPKSDGSERTLGIAALEDKIIQHAMATTLNAIYETDFMGFSYGFRPGRNQQGSVISPLLANVYLHYVLDLWFQAYRQKKARGEVIMVRYADDFIVGFQYKSDANEFQRLLGQRLKKCRLTMHPEKTQLIRFGRYAKQQCRERELRKPKTFTFLGFTHICSHSRNGTFVVKRQTVKKRMRSKLQEIKYTLMKNRHAPVVQQGRWLKRVVQGYFNYHAVPWNSKPLNGFRASVIRYWMHALRRRSQRHRVTWKKYAKLVKLFIPSVKRVHDYPEMRFDAKYSK